MCVAVMLVLGLGLGLGLNSFGHGQMLSCYTPVSSFWVFTVWHSSLSIIVINSNNISIYS